jgi:type II secretory ATPase GspE/PulE/Tfp pilus assembly ATPase PilB-like protein
MGSSDLKLFRGRGCQNCFGSGYKGRTAICEIVTVSPGLRDLIINKGTILKMQEEATKYGFQVIRQDAIRKALTGVTTLQEVARVIG